MTPERTLQQRDPLAALVARPAGYLAAVVVPLYAIGATILHRDDVSNPALAVFAIVLTLMAGIALALQSSPLRAPLTSRTLVLVVGCSALAHAVNVTATWSTDASARDDWGGPAIGLYVLALAPYRPAKELATATVFAAILTGVLDVAQARNSPSGLPPLAFVVVGVTPVLAMGLASAAFADVLVRSLDHWRVRTDRAFSAMSDQRGESIARSVQQDRVTILNQEVVPFFSEVLAGETVTEETRDRARQIADAIRSVMVAEADRTWLDVVLEDVARSSRVGGDALSATVRDEERLAEHMSADQRTALRALIVALHRAGSLKPDASSVQITATKSRCKVLLRAALECDANDARADIAPFLAVMRVAFTDLHVDHDEPTLTLRFSYEQR
ncbi:MAG: hypothetical protein JWM50_1919 [Microbacteriaceae bacterium]|nr:hypothetical protein [Microbacteriaceae bacterium]